MYNPDQFGKESLDKLNTMIKEGCFILKTGEGYHIEDREGMEYIGCNIYLVHYWSEVVK